MTREKPPRLAYSTVQLTAPSFSLAVHFQGPQQPVLTRVVLLFFVHAWFDAAGLWPVPATPVVGASERGEAA